mgnify:CR=1 FL=1
MKLIKLALLFAITFIFATTSKQIYSVNGMMCGYGCVSTIKNSLNSLDGIKSVSVYYETKTMEIFLEDENIEQFGASKLEHLPQKELLDGYACIMCNRCQDICPAYQTVKEMSPASLEINKRYYYNENMKEFSSGAESLDTLSKWMISEEAALSCTTCGFCLE